VDLGAQATVPVQELVLRARIEPEGIGYGVRIQVQAQAINGDGERGSVPLVGPQQGGERIEVAVEVDLGEDDVHLLVDAVHLAASLGQH
jgi:hypothetical protein